MARPKRMGLEYFPMDVDFFEEYRVDLLLYEQGPAAPLVFLRLLCSIYRSGGYFCPFTEITSRLLARRIGGETTAEQVTEIVRTCLRLGLFDRETYERTGMLTSREIQLRYGAAVQSRALKAKKAGRTIRVNGEIWLLEKEETERLRLAVAGAEEPEEEEEKEKEEKEDAPEKDAQERGVFYPEGTISGEFFPEKPDGRMFFPEGERKNPQRKEKERKEKKRKGKESGAGDFPAESPDPGAPAAQPPLSPEGLKLVCVDAKAYEALCGRYGREKVEAKAIHMEAWLRGKGRRAQDCTARLRDWLAQDALAAPASASPAGPPAAPSAGSFASPAPPVGKRTGAHNFSQREYTDEEMERMFRSEI